MTALEIIKVKEPTLEIPDVTWLMAIAEVEQAIKNYCHIDKVPSELVFVVANMSVDLVRYQRATDPKTSAAVDNVTAGDVSSISIGDTRITLGGEEKSSTTATAARKAHIPNLDEIVMNNRLHLNQFRKMVW